MTPQPAIAVPTFVIVGPPRTKKNSSQIIKIFTGGKCGLCGQRPGYPKIMPSKPHEEWFQNSINQVRWIREKLVARGTAMPIVSLVNVKALFYREANVGDLNGFQQALGDLLQAGGIIENDVLIDSWDGSRRLKDAGNPRIEVEITIVQARAVDQDLFAEAKKA